MKEIDNNYERERQLAEFCCSMLFFLPCSESLFNRKETGNPPETVQQEENSHSA